MRWLALFLPAASILGCGTGSSSVEGTGEAVTQVLPVALLNAITVEGSMDVIVERGDTQRVEVIAQPGIIGLVKTKVDNGMWWITTSRDYTTDKGLTVRLTVPMLNTVIVRGSGSVTSEEVYNTGKTHLEIGGSGNIRIDTLRETLVEAWIDGSGGIRIGSGECATLDARISGSGAIQAQELCAMKAHVSIPGSGEMHIDVLDSLVVDVSGSGDVRYRGTPVVISSSSGSGTITAIP